MNTFISPLKVLGRLGTKTFKQSTISNPSLGQDAINLSLSGFLLVPVVPSTVSIIITEAEHQYYIGPASAHGNKTDSQLWLFPNHNGNNVML